MPGVSPGIFGILGGTATLLNSQIVPKVEEAKEPNQESNGEEKEQFPPAPAGKYKPFPCRHNPI